MQSRTIKNALQHLAAAVLTNIADWRNVSKTCLTACTMYMYVGYSSGNGVKYADFIYFLVYLAQKTVNILYMYLFSMWKRVTSVKC